MEKQDEQQLVPQVVNGRTYYEEDVDFPVAQIIQRLTKKYDLTPRMAEFLLYRANTFTDREACEKMGITLRTVRDWKEDKYVWRERLVVPDFRSAYNEFMAKRIEAAGDSFRHMVGKAARRIHEMMDAETKIYYRGEVVATEPDYETRFKGAQAVMRAMGLWDRPVVDDQTGGYKETLNAFQELMAAKQAALHAPPPTIEGSIVPDPNTTLPTSHSTDQQD